MRVAGNKIKHLQAFYLSELQDRYDEAEIRAIFKTVVQHYLGFSQTDLLRKSEENVNQSDLLKIYDTAKFLKEGRPLQYLLKEAWFMNEAYYVDESVLIPRPETEELVDLILHENKTLNSMLDVGTGSGCIPISIQARHPHAHGVGCDVSEGALAVADRNAKKLNRNITWMKADVLSNGFVNHFSEKFDIIVSNPPYIKKSEALEMAEHVLVHEPHLALFVDSADEIIFYRKIISACNTLLKEEGKLYFELNPLTAKDVWQCAHASGVFKAVDIVKDLSGKDRFLSCSKKRT